MKLLIPIEQLNDIKIQNIPCECYYCKSIFYIKKSLARRALKGTRYVKYCSRQCQKLGKTYERIEFECKQCNKKIYHLISQKKCKSVFCSKSCAAKYNNAHKTKGYSVSKLEKWLQQKLIKIYPNLTFSFNCKTEILSELDIYIPSLKLAFELNGIFHYEPIYGLEKLTATQKNDKQKIIRCADKGIELCVIDTTGLKYFKEQKATQYLDIICNIINLRLEVPTGLSPVSPDYKTGISIPILRDHN